MNVVLMGLEFSIGNLGCEALTYAFIDELEKIAAEENIKINYQCIVLIDSPEIILPVEKERINIIRIQYKKRNFWKTAKKCFSKSDVIFDFTMGDSFSDIYGFKRIFLNNMIKDLAIKHGKCYVLGPQTYGPYKNKLIRAWAKRIMKKSAGMFARDEKSKKLAEHMSNREVILTTDVAFSLPYNLKMPYNNNGKIRIGINPSGLLWFGGYERGNQFGLKVDYVTYCEKLIEYLIEQNKYEIYLIPHVGTTVADYDLHYVENDGYVCFKLMEKYPDLKAITDIRTAMDAKGYIASMDIFVGARMHATIGAFSAGVVTIPFSYSPKFEGLFNSLNYKYTINARELNTEDAIKITIEYINDYGNLKKCVKASRQQLSIKQDIFRTKLKEYIK